MPKWILVEVYLVQIIKLPSRMGHRDGFRIAIWTKHKELTHIWFLPNSLVQMQECIPIYASNLSKQCLLKRVLLISVPLDVWPRTWMKMYNSIITKCINKVKRYISTKLVSLVSYTTLSFIILFRIVMERSRLWQTARHWPKACLQPQYDYTRPFWNQNWVHWWTKPPFELVNQD